MSSLIEVQGLQLEVQRLAAAKGLPARCPLLLLHEGLGSVSMWRDWPQRLAQETGREVIVYSRRGYGRSESYRDVRGQGRLQPDYMQQEAWQLLPALLQALELENPVLLGHSDGGSIALLYASRFAPAAAIVIAPHVMVEDLSIRSIEQARDAFLRGDLRERLARHHDDVDGAFWAWNDAWLNPDFRSFDIRDDCCLIRCPLLALQGREDPYGTPEQIRQIQPARASIERHLLEACGHSPQTDQAERTTGLIRDFLLKVP